jgi:hypothetical protein
LREFILPIVYLVVTVTVDRRKIDVPIVVVITIEMMDFNKCIRREDESTGCASSALIFK